MSKSTFVKDHMIQVQGGRDYLPVAPRVVMFRKEHPDWVIGTEVVEIGDALYMKATVARHSTQSGHLDPVATAHKRINTAGRGAAGQYPVETAETGAIGRALALCGYGTIEGGDLDEGEQLADAPVIGRDEDPDDVMEQGTGRGSDELEKEYAWLEENIPKATTQKKLDACSQRAAKLPEGPRKDAVRDLYVAQSATVRKKK